MILLDLVIRTLIPHSQTLLQQHSVPLAFDLITLTLTFSLKFHKQIVTSYHT